MATRIQVRRDTTANWTASNPILAAGEIGYETDSLKRVKLGDGSTAWNSLASLKAAAADLTGDTLPAAIVNSSLTRLGTVTVGVWQATQIDDAYLETIATAGKVSNSATTATSANTANAIVARDANGDFTARNVTVTLLDTDNITATAIVTTANLVTFPVAYNAAAATGRVLIGRSAGLSTANYVNVQGQLEVLSDGADAGVPRITLGRWRDAGGLAAGSFQFFFSRGTYDAPATVQIGDALGQIVWDGYLGGTTSIAKGAGYIQMSVDSVPDTSSADNTVPGRMGFYLWGTLNASLTEVMRLTQTAATINVATTVGAALTVTGTSTLRTTTFNAAGGAVPYAIVAGAPGGDSGSIGYNAVPQNSGGVWNYGGTDFASVLSFPSGGFVFRTAASGTAGNAITFTNAASLTQAGVFTVGTGFSVTSTGAVTGVTTFAASGQANIVGLLVTGGTLGRFEGVGSAVIGGAGAGVEVYAAGMQAYNRTTSALAPFTLDASTIALNGPVSGITSLTASGTVDVNALLVTTSVQIGVSSAYRWSTRSSMESPADGRIVLYNAAGNDFNRLLFGGVTASEPGLFRSATALHVKLANDSGFAPLRCANITVTTVTTDAPSGVSAQPWKLGESHAVSPTAPNRTLSVDVNGSVFFVHAKTTND